MTTAMILLLLRALGETLAMVLASGLIGLLGGIPLGVALFVTGPGRLSGHPAFHRLLGLVINAGRSIPFLILLVAIVPFTRLVTGTSIGVPAAIVPLAAGAIPFMARLVEGALREVPSSLIEAAQSLGASSRCVIWRVLLPEAMPGVLHGATVTFVTLVNYSAVAGAVGGGGLGDVGYRYGYQRFDGTVMVVVVVVLIVLVQAIQWLGERLVRTTDRRY
ncbi:ABC-type metal ion transport system, permease component [Opitutaceae bacterium TAV1]|nr:ABC-type metal ion transport system, permease component [Opitutaceae bacterium TAV1]